MGTQRRRKTSGKRAHLFGILMKRKNCKSIMYINVAISILLLCLICTIGWVCSFQLNDLDLLDHQNNLLIGIHIISFDHCHFDSQYYSTFFHMDRCFDQCGVKAIAWRQRRLATPFMNEVVLFQKRYACLDILHEVDCHEKHKNCIEPRQTFPQCPGMTGTRIPSHIHRLGHIVAPSLNETEFKKQVGSLMLVNELIVRCPVCRVQSDWFKFENEVGENVTCKAKLATISRGWPAYVEFCDNLASEVKPSSECHKFKDKVEDQFNYNK